MIGGLKIALTVIEGQTVKMHDDELADLNDIKKGLNNGKKDATADDDVLLTAPLEKTQGKIDSVTKRLDVIERFLQEATDYNASRGKDLKNRLQLIEELLRGQRDVMVRAGQDTW